MNKTPSDSENIRYARERQQYFVGGALTLLLTLIAFAVIGFDLFAPVTCKFALAGLALAQIGAHFHYFLHIDFRKSHRDDLMLILFTALIIALMVGGTIYIFYDQWSRM